MKRALFPLEFRRIFIPTLIFLGSIRVTLLIGEQFRSVLRPDLPAASLAFDSVALVLLVASGYFSGLAAFSQDFKQKYMFFLQALPLSKSALWWTLLLANLSAALLSLGVALLWTELGAKPLLLGLLIHLVLFCAGSGYALLFRNLSVIAAVGAFATLATLAVTVLLLISFVSDPLFSRNELVPRSGMSGGQPAWIPGLSELQPDLVYFLFCMLALLLLYVFLSYRFFVAGEFYILKVRLKNAGLLLACHLGIFVVLAVAQDFSTFVASDPMEARCPWGAPFDACTAVSPRGDRLAVVERSRRHPQFARVSIVDVKTGKLSGRIRLRGVREIGWSSTGESLIVDLADDAPLARCSYLLPPSDSLAWVSPDGREMSRTRFRFSRILIESFAAGNRLLVVTKSGGRGYVLSIDPSTRKIAHLGSAPLDGQVEIQKTVDRHLVFFHNTQAPPKAWMIASEGRELPFASSTKREGDWYVLNGVVYPSPQSARDQIAGLFPFTAVATQPAASAAIGRLQLANAALLRGYILPSRSGYDANYFDDSGSVFFFRPVRQPKAAEDWSGELWTWHRKRQSWTRLAEGIPSPPKARRFFLYDFLSVAPMEGLAAYCVSRGKSTECYLYDAKIGSALSLGSLPMGRTSVRLTWVGDTASFLINLFQTSESAGPFDPRSPYRVFRYVPGSGVVVPLTAEFPSLFSPLHVDGAGNLIFRTQEGLSWMSASGEQHQLWPIVSP